MYKLYKLKTVNKETVKQINALLGQLSRHLRNLSQSKLRTITNNNSTELWLLKDKKIIIGMASLVFVIKPSSISARIEDVVVAGQYRGRGLGRKLSQKLISRARARGAAYIDLTSKPERVAANNLYKKLGFEKRDTNVYRLSLRVRK